jgi:general secretion pathway protein C
MPLAYGSWFNQLQSKLPNVLALVLALICGALVARLVWQFWPQTDTQQTQTQANQNEVAEAAPSHADNIANQHLFGIAPPSVKPTAPPPSTTPLPNVTLLGVSTISPKLAIIALNNQEKVYKLGETLKPSNAELIGIDAESITLKYNGQKQTIKLRKPQSRTAANPMQEDLSGGIEPTMPPMDGASEPELSPDASQSPTDVPPESPPATAANLNPTAGSNALAQFHKEVIANPAKFMDVIAPPAPVMKDGKMLGFRIMPGKNIALFNQTGLQPGDVITKINGTTMDSAGAGIQALQNSMNSNNLNLEVDRGGQSTPISINF